MSYISKRVKPGRESAKEALFTLRPGEPVEREHLFAGAENLGWLAWIGFKFEVQQAEKAGFIKRNSNLVFLPTVPSELINQRVVETDIVYTRAV